LVGQFSLCSFLVPPSIWRIGEEVKSDLLAVFLNYYIQENLEAEAEVLLDPNNLSEDGTVALNISAVSKNAEFLAVGLSASGSDWVNIKVIRVADKSTEPDSLSWVKFLTSC
jgi:prolyl oligopeptidase PreP (S9A serine peptidase family)